MKLDVQLGGREASVVVRRDPAGGYVVELDGGPPRRVQARRDGATGMVLEGDIGPTRTAGTHDAGKHDAGKYDARQHNAGTHDAGKAGRVKLHVAVRGDAVFVLDGVAPLRGEVVDPRKHALDHADGGGAGHIVTQMPGAIVRVPVQLGQAVRQGDVLVVVEAMKMENELKAPFDGVVAELHAVAGTAVDAGALLVRLSVPADGAADGSGA